ncbi:MAG TPA: patatin-like phospholipase family protein [Clostridia bacterium]|nr:patatin-like phospholipase family protein [Clostridia bacterium]
MPYPKIGLALSGGASRGFAHIGVIQVLLENDIPIGCVAGCSMGSIIGAVWATGSDIYMMEKYAYTINEKDIFDITVPRMGLMKGNKAYQIIRTLTKGKTFEEADIPLSLVATDIITARSVVLNSGLICDAVRASISIPGIFDPVERDGMLLVDGGVTERVPIKTIKTMKPDIIIAVDVGYRGFARKKPQNIFEVLMQSYEITDWEITRNMLKQADVVITPNVYEINPATLSDTRKCVAAGRVAAEAAIPEIKNRIEDFLAVGEAVPVKSAG